LSTILDGSNRGLFTDAEFAKRVADCSPLVSSKIELGLTSAANDSVVVYETSDSVKCFLAAIAAWDGKLNDPS